MATVQQSLPKTQHALLLIGPDKLQMVTDKNVPVPGPKQLLAKVEAVGLCFSDLKLLKQFSAHARKSEIVNGLTADVLREIPGYVPGSAPTVPGHEVVCQIVSVGSEVKHHRIGERCLVQTDYRYLKTASSCAAFGYNFEGALQEYSLMDERVIVDPKGERCLIPVDARCSASAIALVEPMACVENSYVNEERRTLKAGGALLVVAEAGHSVTGMQDVLKAAKPASLTALCADAAQTAALKALGLPQSNAADLSALPNESFDDIIYFGAVKERIEVLNDKLAAHGLINIVAGGKKIGKLVSVGVGRVHYGMCRWIGTTGVNASDSYKIIPATTELRANDRMVVIGAGGPMGQMHVIRAVCSGVAKLSITAADIDDGRLASLQKKVDPMAQARSVSTRMVNTKKTPLLEKFSYFALMAPVGQLVADAIRDSQDGALINIFAGIPAPTKHDLDLDAYLQSRCYMFGTSGSVVRDMKIVLKKIEAGQLDTNCLVDAISGMAGAAAGIAAVENRTLSGKIIVYPMLHDLGLVPLSNLEKVFPTVAKLLDHGAWTKAAEEELLRVALK